jgi:signal transduction histidine kinase
MDLSHGIPTLGPALLAPVGPAVALAHQVAVGLIGLVAAAVAHRAWGACGGESWRRLRFFGMALVASAVLRGASAAVAAPVSAVLGASASVLDLALFALALGAVLQLRPARRRSDLAVLGGLALSAVFLGLLGGEAARSLVARNLPAVLVHLAALAAITARVAAEWADHLRRARDAAETRADMLLLERQQWQVQAEVAENAREDAESRAARSVEIARDAGRRARLLEHLLAGAVDLPARRDPQDLQQYTVELVSVLFGFDRVVLHQWSSSLGAFSVQASTGVSGAEAEALRGTHTDRVRYEQLVHPRFRISDSFLVPPASAAWPPRVPADEAAWPDDQRLIVPLTDPAGTVHGFLELQRPEAGHAPDVLRIRYLELLVRQIAALLDVQEVREHLATCRAELAHATDRLQALGDLRSNFVANVSHELRTPLTSIIGYAEMLRDRGRDMSEEVRHEFLDVILEQGQQFREIINDLLDLDRMEEGPTRRDRTECDLAALTRRLAEDWRQRADRGGIDLQVEVAARRIVMEADPVLCQQLLGHLVGNALKFTPSGGRVAVRVIEQGTAARVEVEDTGIGIPEDKLHTIFEQFYQVDASSTREKGGQGIGLAICQDIVSWHDGRIWAENMPDGGARLTVLLPRRPHVVLPDPPASINPVLHEPRLFLQRLVHWVGENLGVRNAVVLTGDADGDTLQALAATGVAAGQLQELRLAPGVGLAGQVWQEGRSRLEVPAPGDVLLAGEAPVLCVPLTAEHDDQPRGVVAVRDRVDGRPLGEDDRLLLEAMAPLMVSLLERYEDHEGSVRDFAAIQSSLRVTTRVGSLPHADVASVCQEVCLATARRLGLPEVEVRHLAFALQYYDVGLGSVPPYLLNKTGALTEHERVQLQRHVQVGLVTLAPLQPSPKVRQIILHHHENYDGTGYPKGLAGEAIPLGSRLIALADSLRALLQRRPWRPAVPLSEALAEIQALAGTRYCPRLTAVFLEEAQNRRLLIEDLRQRADDGEDLKRPASLHPVQLVRG